MSFRPLDKHKLDHLFVYRKDLHSYIIDYKSYHKLEYDLLDTERDLTRYKFMLFGMTSVAGAMFVFILVLMDRLVL